MYIFAERYVSKTYYNGRFAGYYYKSLAASVVNLVRTAGVFAAQLVQLQVKFCIERVTPNFSNYIVPAATSRHIENFYSVNGVLITF